MKIRGGNGSDDNIIMSLTGYAHAACTWLGGKKKNVLLLEGPRKKIGSGSFLGRFPFGASASYRLYQ